MASDLRDPAGDRPPRRPRRAPAAGRLRARDGVRGRPGRGRAGVRRRRARGSTSSISTARGPGRRPRRDRSADILAAVGERRRGRGRRRAARRSARSRRPSTAARHARSSAPRRSRDPAFAGRLVAAHGAERIAVAIDVRDGRRCRRGLAAADAPGVDAEDAIGRLADAGVDDLRGHRHRARRPAGGPGPRALRAPGRASTAGAIIASGGIASLDDIAGGPTIGCRGSDRRPGALRGALVFARRRRGGTRAG